MTRKMIHNLHWKDNSGQQIPAPLMYSIHISRPVQNALANWSHYISFVRINIYSNCISSLLHWPSRKSLFSTREFCCINFFLNWLPRKIFLDQQLRCCNLLSLFYWSRKKSPLFLLIYLRNSTSIFILNKPTT